VVGGHEPALEERRLMVRIVMMLMGIMRLEWSALAVVSVIASANPGYWSRPARSAVR
jgi:hypothetical protein